MANVVTETTGDDSRLVSTDHSN